MEKNYNEKKCSTCNETNAKTVLLTCSHCFCSSCLYKQIFYNYSTYQETQFDEEMQFSCVICKEGNHTISKKEIFEFLKAPIIQNDSPVFCKNKHGLKVESYCKKCNWEMCEMCYKQHSSISLFADHQITTDIGIANLISTCFTHKDKKLKFQCLKCFVPLCGICREVDHFQHKVSFIDDYYNSIQKQIKLIKMPEDSYESFKQKLKNQEEKAIGELKNKSIQIYDRIEILINQLIEIKKNFEIKVNNIEDELTKTTYVHDKIFEKLYYDINNIRSCDFNNLNLLKKIPESYKNLEFNQTYLEKFEILMKNLESSTKDVEKEIINIDKINFNIYHEAMRIQTSNVEQYKLTSIVRMPNGNIACSNLKNQILIFDGVTDCKLINTLTVTAKPENELRISNVSINSLLSMPDGTLVVACSDSRIQFWSSNLNYQFLKYVYCQQTLQNLYINNINTLIFGFSSGNLYIWGSSGSKIITYETFNLLIYINLNEYPFNGECLYSQPEYQDRGMPISVKNHQLAVNSFSEIKIIDFADQYDIKFLQNLNSHKKKINNLLSLEEGKFASSSEDFSIKIWAEENDTYICIKTIVAYTNNFKLLSYLNKKFATISSDGIIKIWDNKFKPVYNVVTDEKGLTLNEPNFLTVDNHYVTLSNGILKIYKI